MIGIYEEGVKVVSLAANTLALCGELLGQKKNWGIL